MFTLKDYQAKALSALDSFFRQLRVIGMEEAWKACAPTDEARDGSCRQRSYSRDAMGETPAVCVRIPTGGGKTFLAAHAVAQVGKALLDTDAPIALWLVPSDAIRTQTLEALSSPRNPCREALTEYFGEHVRVCGLDELATVGPQEIGRAAIVVVATIQSFNVKEKSQRTVYSFDESLTHHFQGLTPQQEASLDRVTEADIAAQPYLTPADIGRIKTSIANWITLRRPIVIVDEAHNNRTEQAFTTLRNLHPACLIELTATPVEGSNVLYHVGAFALQREDMIKLPIVLMEHPTGWIDAVRDAVLTRDRLERLAAKEIDYIRPVVLFQAEPKNGEVTVEKLFNHLTSPDGENIDVSQVARATGSYKELDGVTLGDPICPIRYVITVEALKEGWDCPFAYVLCGLQDARSAKDVEQLLGRVLRMPYARPRSQPDMGKAYAHIVADGFAKVADTLADRLVSNMGFERYEANLAFAPAQGELPSGGSGSAPLPAQAVVTLPSMPAHAPPDALKAVVELRPTSHGATAIIHGELTEEVEDFLLASCNSSMQRDAVKEAVDLERIRQAALLAPSARGVQFASMPQLCFDLDGDLQPVERRVLAELGEFDLFAEPISLAGFDVCERGHAFEIGLTNGVVRYAAADSEQLHLNEVAPHATEQDLVRSLARECRQVDVFPADMTKWLLALIRHLQADRHFTLTALIRGRFLLAESVKREIDRRRDRAISSGFQNSLPGFVCAPRENDGFRYGFTFDPNRYPARSPFYSGRFRFKKHYYPVIHDLREKRASKNEWAEEFVCAQAIDVHPEVKHWVRNVEREPRFSFWLPTSTDYFYPDFICELRDGRILAVEYKGEPYKTNDDSREKNQVGDQWEHSSDGKCLYMMAVSDDALGRDVARQIDNKIRQR
jgi:type III restriction enzyme